MASVLAKTEMTSPKARPLAAARPQWWRQVHSYVFAGVVAGNLLFPGLFAAVVTRLGLPGVWEEIFLFTLIGVGLGQLFLLGIWVTLGGLHTAIRLVIAPLVLVACGTVLMASIVVVHEVGSFDDKLWAMMLIAMIVASTVLLMLNATLLPFRWLLGWRVDFDPAYHPPVDQGRMQVGIKHLIGWTIYCALPFALARTISIVEEPGSLQDLPSQLSVYGLMGVLAALVVAGPLCLACLSQRRFWLWLVGSLGWCFAVTLIFSMVLRIIGDVGPHLGIFSLPVTVVMTGLVLGVAGNLLFLRLFGLRLFSVKKITQ